MQQKTLTVKGTGGEPWKKSNFSLNAMTPLNLVDLEQLIGELAKIKADIKAKEAMEETSKADIQEAMSLLDLASHSTDKGVVRIQAGRGKRKYREAVVEAEAKYKALKKLADDMGDYDEEPGKPTVVFNFPKVQKPENEEEPW